MGMPRDLVSFVVDGRRCALHLEVVERVEPMVAVRDLPSAPSGVLGAIDVHGTAVAVFDVRARTTRRMVALPVDDVIGVDAVSTVTDAGSLDLSQKWMAGVTQRSGGLALIYDLEGFLSLDAERQLAPALVETAP